MNEHMNQVKEVMINVHDIQTRPITLPLAHAVVKQLLLDPESLGGGGGGGGGRGLVSQAIHSFLHVQCCRLWFISSPNLCTLVQDSTTSSQCPLYVAVLG